jgi:hypothetical protein
MISDFGRERVCVHVPEIDGFSIFSIGNLAVFVGARDLNKEKVVAPGVCQGVI